MNPQQKKTSLNLNWVATGLITILVFIGGALINAQNKLDDKMDAKIDTVKTFQDAKIKECFTATKENADSIVELRVAQAEIRTEMKYANEKLDRILNYLDIPIPRRVPPVTNLQGRASAVDSTGDSMR
jgi:hypothetical protein